MFYRLQHRKNQNTLRETIMFQAKTIFCVSIRHLCQKCNIPGNYAIIFTTLKNDYAELGIELDVVHHSQFIDELIQTEKIKPNNWVEEDITFHDPCYLGRHNNEYDAPRNVLQSLLKDGEIKEMEKSKSESFCCGAGGGNMWYEIKTGERINQNRIKQAVDTQAKTVAAACNFCNIMLEDGVKTTENEDNIRVLDIAEMVAEGLKEKRT